MTITLRLASTAAFVPIALSLIPRIDPAAAAPVKALDAQAVRASAPTLQVWQEGGLNISFIATGEVVKKVWLDDISRLALDFDRQLCAPEEQGCESDGASVIHLRRIAPINFPGVPKTKTTLLSVVTEKAGKKNLYNFRLAYGTGTPQYVAVDIVPNLTPKPQPLLPVQTPQSEKLQSAPAPPIAALPPQQPAALTPPQADVTPPLAPNAIVPEPPPPRKRQAPPPRSASEVATAVELGLKSAQEQKLISQERRNLYLETRVRRFLSFVRQGTSPKESARRSDLPLHFVDTLERLGTRRQQSADP